MGARGSASIPIGRGLKGFQQLASGLRPQRSIRRAGNAALLTSGARKPIWIGTAPDRLGAPFKGGGEARHA